MPHPGAREASSIAESGGPPPARRLRRVGAVRGRPGGGGGLEVSAQESTTSSTARRLTPPVRLVSGGPTRAFVPGIGGTRSATASPLHARVTVRRSPRPVWAADIDLDPATARATRAAVRPLTPAPRRDRAPAGRHVALPRVLRRAASGAGDLLLHARRSTSPSSLSLPCGHLLAPRCQRVGQHPDRALRSTGGLHLRRRVPGPRDPARRGAHLDSVGVGPGINDNGSGSATIPIRRADAQGQPRNRSASSGSAPRHGCSLGVRRQPAAVRARQDRAMLNFDMVGSPNFGARLHATSRPARPGALAGLGRHRAALPRLFGQGLATEPTAFDGRSDYASRRRHPRGLHRAGSRPREAAIYGGTAVVVRPAHLARRHRTHPRSQSAPRTRRSPAERLFPSTAPRDRPPARHTLLESSPMRGPHGLPSRSIQRGSRPDRGRRRSASRPRGRGTAASRARCPARRGSPAWCRGRRR